MTDTEPCNAQRSAEKAACDLTGDWVHIRRSNLQALRHKAARAENVDRLRREAGLWRAGVRPMPVPSCPPSYPPTWISKISGGAAACPTVLAAVLGTRAQLDEGGRDRHGRAHRERADEIAGELEAAVARAREHQANVERADELALRVAAHEAGVPLPHPVGRMFLRQYDGPADRDHLIVAWHRQVLNDKPPAAVTERLP